MAVVISPELAHSVHAERVHKMEAEASWRMVRRQLDAARRRGQPRQGLLRRLAGLVAMAAERSGFTGQDAGAGAGS